MKFIDEAVVTVESGKGGHGCLSFRREKYIQYGGPNGGNGGRGANVVLKATDGLNTLIDFRFKRSFKADNGQPGQGQNKTGVSGKDLIIPVPVGTFVYLAGTDELLGDLRVAGQELLVAHGGRGGLGNAHFKSSVTRAPRRTTDGTASEQLQLRLALSILADVGLLGLPNAGKSTLIRTVSNAKPKVADYPFTTLVPNIGVVRVNYMQSFVLADIPGLIPGAASGAGLGIRFLKHLARTRLLLHLVDIGNLEGTVLGEEEVRSPAEVVQSLADELALASQALSVQPRWLVLNKCDLLDDDVLQTYKQQLIQDLNWQGPVFCISAATGEGTAELMQAVMQEIEQYHERLKTDVDFYESEKAMQHIMQQEVRQSIVRHRQALKEAAAHDEGLESDVSDQDEEDDTPETEIIYVRE